MIRLLAKDSDMLIAPTTTPVRTFDPWMGCGNQTRSVRFQSASVCGVAEKRSQNSPCRSHAIFADTNTIAVLHDGGGQGVSFLRSRRISLNII
jgi:hypothetical protein